MSRRPGTEWQQSHSTAFLTEEFDRGLTWPIAFVHTPLMYLAMLMIMFDFV